ncbi:adipocyte enhancer-binding protein 1-like [Branchiostoma lanceolatum]|uniref:adipocyte enhancer-binding protein 1-like n=1 Tax=Branchiostoma lanceolatum TaxID=7740 RepID=UPI0034515024
MAVNAADTLLCLVGLLVLLTDVTTTTETCSVEPFGMENAAATITASTVHQGCSTERALLNSQPAVRDDTAGGWAAAWCAADQYAPGQWLQVDLNSTTSIAGVITQGRADIDQWVTSYKLTFSSDGAVWDTYSEQGQEKLFEGNTDRTTEVEHLLVPPVTARFVRLNPLTSYAHTSMRVEVLLCAQATTTETATTTTLADTTTTPVITTTTPAVTTTTPAVTTTTPATTTTTPATSTVITTRTSNGASTVTTTTSSDVNIVTTAMIASPTTSRPGEGGSAAANTGGAPGGKVAGGVVGTVAIVGAGVAIGGYLLYKKKKVTVEPTP